MSQAPAEGVEPARGATGADQRFPPIAAYGFLSDSHTSALVAPDGSVEWLCLPRFDSPSLFGAILDRRAGYFRVGPRDVHVPVSRRYEPGTNVLETTWMTSTGWLVVRDALTIGEWREPEAEDAHTRPPTDHEAERRLVRTLECTYGKVDVELDCSPAFDYGARTATWAPTGDSGNAAAASDHGLEVLLTSDMRLGIEGPQVIARHRLSEGEQSFCALAWGEPPEGPRSLAEAGESVSRTSRFWREWLEHGSFPDHEWRMHLQRSALLLKGLIYAPTGATVAAATTSLPETLGGERNWDYRYSWIRDATFTLFALHILGFDWEADDFISFVSDVTRGEGHGLQIMYGIGGEKNLAERTLDGLSGYDGSRPVRVGNAAFEQRQNDVYGALLDSIYIHSKAQDHLADDLWWLVTEQVEVAAKEWREPDQGIWEARGAPQHYVSSKLMCWVALDRGARLASLRGEEEAEERWSAIAEEIQSEILARGVSKRGVFRQHYDSDALDASTLLAPLVRFLPPDDERVRNTVMAIDEELTEHGLVLRYRVQETDDGLSGEEGAFLICSFWLVSALSEIGEAERARMLCERLLTVAGPLDLYAEELDPRSGRHLGNFPQAFTHLALINAVSHVIADETRAPGRTGPTAVFSELRAMR
jgi:alpha,alpha-trehalase